MERQLPPRFRPRLSIDMPSHYQEIFTQYKEYSMIAENPRLFMENLLLMDYFGRAIDGDFIECGTWKGGMSCAMMAIGGTQRDYHFFDSFEGLPDAKPIDGTAAQQYQANTSSPLYRDNCHADYEAFTRLVHSQNIEEDQIHIYKGWFSKRLPDYPGNPISVLRLDGDWYESTMTCLEHLYPYVAHGGIILIDDYDAWDGCARAVHDYLSKSGSRSRIQRTPLTQIAYIQKLEETGQLTKIPSRS